MRLNNTIVSTLLVGLAWGLLAVNPAVAKKSGGGGNTARYTIVDLSGLPGGDWIEGYASAVSEPDDDGNIYVVGTSRTPAATFNPVLWLANVDGTATLPMDLGLPEGMRSGDANAVSDVGVVTIQATEDVQGRARAWVLVPGGDFQELPRTASDSSSWVHGVNTFGAIVGKVDGSGALWTLDSAGLSSVPTSLGTFSPHAINDRGTMVGEQHRQAAIAWLDGEGNLQVQELGPLPGYSDSRAVAISENGIWVAGNASRYEQDRKGAGAWYSVAFVWSADTGMVNMGTLARRGWNGASNALGVNNAGQVVGWSETGRIVPRVAFLWEDGRMIDLNTLVDAGTPYLPGAASINNAGHIAGTFTDPAPNDPHGYLLILK